MRAAFRPLFAVLAAAALGACATAPAGTRSPTPTADKYSGKPLFVRKDFFGRDAAALDAALGAPALSRREGEGEFRRYAFAECALIVILYPDEKGTMTAQALDAAAKTSTEEKPDLDECLARGPERSGA